MSYDLTYWRYKIDTRRDDRSAFLEIQAWAEITHARLATKPFE